MRNLKLDNHTRVFTGIIARSNYGKQRTVLDIELLGLSSATNYENTQIYHPSRKIVIISPNVKVQIAGDSERIEIPTPLGLMLSSLPVGIKIAFTGKSYDPSIKHEKNPLSIEDNDRIILDNEYLEVIEFNSTIARKVLKHQVSEEKKKKSHEEWKKKFYGDTFFKKLSVKLSPFFPKWLQGLIVAVIGGLIVGFILLVFGDSIKQLFSIIMKDKSL